ncbi:PsbP-related protein [Methanobacterium sp.]|uniref:PsbP-related protein n=1 Tax=Methanobacterium sp. TaxID=2164 RepID=UPI003C74A09D
MILIEEVDKLKKYLFTIILLLSIVLISGCTTTGNQTASNTSTGTKSYNGDQFNFNYPATWQLITSQAQNSTIAVGDPASADKNGNVQVNVEIQTLVKPSNVTIQDYYNSTYAQFAAQNLGYKQLSDGTITVNGKTALENVYVLSSISKEQRAVWIQNRNTIYIILCSAPISQYNDEQDKFNTIVNSFKLI